MSKNKTFHQVLIIGGTLFALMAAWYAWWIRPQQVQIAILQSQAQGVVRQVQAATIQVQQIEALQKNIEKLQDELQQIEKRLFPRDQLPVILRKMVRLGETYNLRFSAVYPKYDQLLQGVASNGSPLLILPVEIQVDGEFIRFGRYIEQLNHQPYLFTIVRMDMAMTPDSYPLVRVVLRGNLFLLLKPDETRPKVG